MQSSPAILCTPPSKSQNSSFPIYPPMGRECCQIGVTVFPTPPPPPEPPKDGIPEKLLRIMAKYHFSWRINELSIPTKITKKFIEKSKEAALRLEMKTKPKRLSEEIKYYRDQMSKPALRLLYSNLRAYGKTNRKLNKTLQKNIRKTWDTIYNYYRKKEHDRNIRKYRREQTKKPKTKLDLKRYDELSKPKPVFKAPELLEKKPKQTFAAYEKLGDLASPKVFKTLPPKSLEVNPAALTYEPTEIVMRLAKIPDRFLNIPKPLEPGAVKRGALRYKITPRIEEMAVPKRKVEKTKVDEEFDPFAISKNALKYKATPRIIELAKHVERD